MDKYYTPELSEFFVGFQYEEKGDLQGWYKTEFGDSNGEYNNELSEVSWGINHDKIRVKYLSQEDIESLGFISSNVIDVLKEEAEFIKGFEKDTYILYIQEDKKLVIYNQKEYDISNKITGNWTEEILFKGLIKNKSELIKLLKQLKIE